RITTEDHLGSAVVEIASGSALTVHIVRWGELGESVGGDAHLPVTLMHHVVMETAQQDPVHHAGRPAQAGRVDMVRVTPPRRPVTGGEGAAAVAQNQRPPDRAGEQSSRGAQ